MNTTDNYPATLTIEQAGKLLGLSRSSAYRAAARGELPTLRFGRRLLVPLARLHALLGIKSTDAAGGGANDDDAGRGSAGSTEVSIS